MTFISFPLDLCQFWSLFILGKWKIDRQSRWVLLKDLRVQAYVHQAHIMEERISKAWICDRARLSSISFFFPVRLSLQWTGFVLLLLTGLVNQLWMCSSSLTIVFHFSFTLSDMSLLNALSKSTEILPSLAFRKTVVKRFSLFTVLLISIKKNFIIFLFKTNKKPEIEKKQSFLKINSEK